jgi:hypothetical protein
MASFPVCLVGDVGRRALGFDVIADPVGVIGFIGQDNGILGQVGQQHRRSMAVMGLPRRQRQTNRQAVGVHKGMDLGRQSVSAATHATISTPFFCAGGVLWLEGTLSPLARRSFEAQKWVVHEKIATRLDLD